MLEPAFPGQATRDVVRLGGGFANDTYLVTLEAAPEPVVLRVYVRDRSAARREAAILARVRPYVQVPEVLYVSPSEQNSGASYMVMSWVEGSRLDDVIQVEGHNAYHAVRTTGQLIAQLQRIQFSTPGFFRDDAVVDTPFSLEPESILEILARFLFADGGAQRLGSPTSQHLWSFVVQHAGSLASVRAHASLVHGDCNPLNVIVRNSGQAAGVTLIDWEYAHSGSPMVDLGSMLRAAPPDRGWYEDALVDGYKNTGGALPERWREASKILDLVKLSGFVRSPQAGDVAIAGVRAAIEAALDEA